MEQREIAIAEHREIDLGADDALARALAERRERVLRVVTAPQEPMDFELDDAVPHTKEGVGIRRWAHLPSPAAVFVGR